MYKMILGLLVLLNLSICFASSPDSCRPDFPYDTQRWRGSDAAYSIPLPNGTSVWLFGDTFYSVPGEAHFTSRSFDRIVSNTIAITSCASAKTTYYFGNSTAENELQSFFKMPSQGAEHIRYWPRDGFYYNDQLYIFLLRVRTVEGATGFGFENTHVDVAIVSNPLESPDLWKYEIRKINESLKIYPGTSLVVQGDHLYLLTTLHLLGGVQDVGLTRINLADFNAGKNKYQYFSKDKQWIEIKKWNWLKQEAFSVLLPDAGMEMSVRYHADIKKWVAISSGNMLSGGYSVSYAQSIEGPWGPLEKVFLYPEGQMQESNYVPKSYCYAAKEHIQYSTAENFWVTYICNSFDLNAILNRKDVYIPRWSVTKIANEHDLIL